MSETAQKSANRTPFSTPYSFDGGKITIRRNPFTFIKALSFGYDHGVQTSKRDLFRGKLSPEMQQKYAVGLLNNGGLSEDEIVLFLKSGRMCPKVEETLAMALDSQEHIKRILTTFDADTSNHRPIQNLRLRGKIAVKLDNQNLLAVLEDWMEIDFGKDLETVAKRLGSEVSLEKALELIQKIKTDSGYGDGKVVNRGLKRLLLENALGNLLFRASLPQPHEDAVKLLMDNRFVILKALEETDGIPKAANSSFMALDGKSPIFESFLQGVSNISFADGMALAAQLTGEQRKAALSLILNSEKTMFELTDLLTVSKAVYLERISAFLSDSSMTGKFSEDELMLVAGILVDARMLEKIQKIDSYSWKQLCANQKEAIRSVLKKNPQLPDNVWLELQKTAFFKIDLSVADALDMLESLDRAILMRFANAEIGRGRIPKASVAALERALQEAAAYVGMLVDAAGNMARNGLAPQKSALSVMEALELIDRHPFDESAYSMQFKRMILDGAIGDALSKRSLIVPSEHLKATVNELVGKMASLGCSMLIYEDDARTKLTTYGRILEEAGRITGLKSPVAVELWLREPGEHIVK